MKIRFNLSKQQRICIACSSIRQEPILITTPNSHGGAPSTARTLGKYSTVDSHELMPPVTLTKPGPHHDIGGGSLTPPVLMQDSFGKIARGCWVGSHRKISSHSVIFGRTPRTNLRLSAWHR